MDSLRFSVRLPAVTVALRALEDDDLDELFRWESDPAGVRMAAFTRADPADRAAFDAHYQRVRSDPDTNNQAIEEDGALAGMIASFTVEGERELTYWIDPGQWGRGIASAAVRMFLRCETQRPLFARAAAHNIGSNTVLLRNGFVKIGEETSWAAGVGENVLEYIYRLD
jgi:RimJ/RimL family protein N-acetyltransferase